MPPAASLFQSESVEWWQACLGAYSKTIQAFSEKKLAAAVKAKKPKPKPTLLELDTWYQHDLPSALSSRSPPHMTHAEITKLMKWKLTRGKFRPRLSELVQENPEEMVRSCTEEAFEHYSKERDLAVALQKLTALKAVGPATASAILCCRFPDSCPFMSDESVVMATQGGPIAYTAAAYTSYAAKVMTKTRKLKAKDKSRKWTAHDVELALWTCKMAESLGVDIGYSPAGEADAADGLEPAAKRAKPS